MEKWQSVILEWVTVLNPGHQISDFSSLLDGLFLVNILDKLSCEDSSIMVVRNNPQESIHQFVKTHYPNYGLTVEPTNVIDLEEVTFLSSLIIHYSSISTEKFRDQACKLLSSDSQKYIVNFLTALISEDGILVSSKVTRKLIQDAILSACRDTPKINVKTSSSRYSTPKRTEGLLRSHVKRTLNEFINSPEGRRQQQMEQYAREIRNLKARLDVETDHNCELEEDVKLRDNKLEKMNKELEERGRTISKLKSDLLTYESQMENRTNLPTKNQSLLQLKSELKITKQLLEQTQANYEKCEQERHTVAYKLIVAETELKNYKEKNVEYEEKSMELESIVQTQTNQIVGLQEELKELKEILNEYKTKNNVMNQSSDSLGPDPPETLDTVIEIKLHEKEEEKRLLESKLTNLTTEYQQLQNYIDQQKLEMVKVKYELREKDDHIKDVNSEIKCLKVALDKTNKEFKILQSSNFKLKEQIESSRDDYNEQLKKREELIFNYKTKQHELEEKLCEQSMELSSKERSLCERKQQIEKLNAQIENINQNLADKANQIASFEKQIKNMSEVIKKNQIEREHVSSELLTIKASEEAKILQIEQLTKELANEQSTTFDLLVEKETLTKQLQEIQAENNSKDSTIKEIRRQIMVLQSDLLKLNSPNLQVENSSEIDFAEQSQLVDEMENLQNMLRTHIDKGIKVIKEREDLKEFLQKTIDTNEREITEQLSTITRHEAQIEELVKENTHLQAKHELLWQNLEKQTQIVESLKSERQQLNQALNELKKEFLHTETELKDNQCTKLILEQERDALKNKLEEQLIAMDELNYEFEKLKIENRENVKNLENLLSEKDRVVANIQKQYSQQLELSEKHLEVINELKADLETKSNKITILEGEKKTLDEKLKNIKNNIMHLEANVVKHKHEISSKKDQIDSLQNEITALSEHHKLAINEKNEKIVSMHDEFVAKYDADIKEKNTQIAQLRNDISRCNEEISSLQNCLRNNQNNIDLLCEEKRGLEIQCASLLETQKEHFELQKKYSIIRQENQTLNSNVNEFCATIDRLKLTIENFEQSSARNNEKNIALMRDYESKIKNLTIERDQVELELKESTESLNQLKETCAKHEKQRNIDGKALQALSEEKESLTQKIADLESIQAQLNIDILVCKKQILIAEENLAKKEEEHKLHINTYEDKLERLNAELDEKVKLSAETQAAYFNLKDVSQGKYVELEEKLQEKDKEISNLQDQIKELKESIVQLEKDKCVLLKESKKLDEKVKNEAMKSKQDYDILVSDYEKMEKVRTTIENTKNQLEAELSQVQEALVKSEMNKDKIIDEYTTEIAKLKEMRDVTYEQLKSEIQDKENQLASLRKENQTIVAHIEILEYEKKELQSQLDRTEQTIQRLENERDSLLKKEAEARKILESETQSTINILKTEHSNEMKNMRETLEKMLQRNSKLESEIAALQSQIGDHEEKLEENKNLQKAYEKLFTEHNELQEKFTKYKSESERHMQMIEEHKKKNRETRSEYDLRLEKMKEKFKAMYHEEVQKFETKSRSEKEILIKQFSEQIRQSEENNQSLQSQIWELRNSYLAEKKSKETLQMRLEKNFFGDMSQESFPPSGRGTELFQGKLAPVDTLFARNSNVHGSCMSLDERSSVKQESETFFVSLPRESTSKKSNRVYPEHFKEPTIPKQTTRQHPGMEMGPGLRMEDEEEEMWNGPYLNDLKSGSLKIDSKDRVSELQKRNTLCLPHLKSSYPVETQFLTPNKCREDDVKFGQALDDSLKTCLIPEEKQAKRNKDRTTTSYKKPGPPTPSKNGGRVSTTSSDTSHVLKEQYPNNTSITQAVPRKPSTPNRIRSFFSSSRNSSTLGNENNENQAVTPTRRRLSIFRKH